MIIKLRMFHLDTILLYKLSSYSNFINCSNNALYSTSPAQDLIMNHSVHLVFMSLYSPLI